MDGARDGDGQVLPNPVVEDRRGETSPARKESPTELSRV
jgi:hypothetical protein